MNIGFTKGNIMTTTIYKGISITKAKETYDYLYCGLIHNTPIQLGDSGYSLRVLVIETLTNDGYWECVYEVKLKGELI